MQRNRLAWERLETRLLFYGVPVLHSNPLAEHKIFLDFDGHMTAGTSWNLEFPSIASPPFDIDNRPDHFSTIEQSRIISIWERMAEDFRPFNVDVTTEDPSVTEPEIFVDGGRAQRVVFTSKFHSTEYDTQRWFDSDAPGAAVESWHVGLDTPVFVFSTHALAGEIGSHEVGHAIGLRHDSALTADGVFTEYRGEHGEGATRWSPIMGQGNALSQWSQGEYPDATNLESDVGILTSALGRRSDDYVGVTVLPGSEISESGCNDRHIDMEAIVSTSIDSDIFSFEACGSANDVSLEVHPWHNGPNLDIAVSLLDESGIALVRRSDETVNPIDALHSVLDVRLDAGTYYLKVDGVGKLPTATDPGYSDYGSLGYYRIFGTIAPGSTDNPLADDELSIDLDSNGAVDEFDFQILQQNFGSVEANRSDGDLNGDNRVSFVDFLRFADYFGKLMRH